MKVCPHCGEPLDARGAKWRVRVRLYETDVDEPLADSDPDQPAGEPGSAVIHSLPMVAQHVLDLAHRFHVAKPGELPGLEMDKLRHSLKSLRPTLSRRGGNGTWRIPYTSRLNGRLEKWIARVDVVRETPARKGKAK